MISYSSSLKREEERTVAKRWKTALCVLALGAAIAPLLRGRPLGERLLLPSNMLRAGEQVFLDDVTLAQVEETLGVSVRVVDAESGFDLVDAMLGMEGDPAPAPWNGPGEETEYYQYNP